LVNRRLADSGFLTGEALGARVYTGGETWDIIGVVDDIRGTGLANPPAAEIFANLEGTEEAATLFEHGSPYFAVRTGEDPTSLIPAIRSVVSGIDPRLAPERIATMDDLVVNSILQPRFHAVALGLLALIAGTLAVVGICGGIAFAVSCRTREIGIRTALGASKRQVFGAICRDTLVVAGVGLAVGMLGGAALTRYLERMLFGLTPLDPAVFVVAPLLFGVAILIAGFLAARPALSVSPLASLRHE
jgi:putative ABC transport system permease protein